jgi:hypothetical protein
VHWSRWISTAFIAVLIFAFSISHLGAQASAPAAPQSSASARSKPAPAPAANVPLDASRVMGKRKMEGPAIPGMDMKTGVPLYETIQEDWSSLDIGVSKLDPEPPVVGPVDTHEKFTRQLVQVQWRPGDPIDLWIVLPKGVKNPPAVLYLYNYDADTDRFRNDGWCERVSDGGMAAVGFVSALSGPRFHDRPLRQWFVSELQESLGSTVHDVKFILDYLSSRGDVDMNRVGIVGQGSGGSIAILAAAADPRIKAIDLLEPWGDWPVFLAKSPLLELDPTKENHENYGKPEFLKKVAPLEPVTYLPKLKIPIRMQQIKESNVVPMESKEVLKDALPKQALLRRFETASDLFHEERGGMLFAWVAGELKSLPPAPQAPLAVAGGQSPDGKVNPAQ